MKNLMLGMIALAGLMIFPAESNAKSGNEYDFLGSKVQCKVIRVLDCGSSPFAQGYVVIQVTGGTVKSEGYTSLAQTGTYVLIRIIEKSNEWESNYFVSPYASKYPVLKSMFQRPNDVVVSRFLDLCTKALLSSKKITIENALVFYNSRFLQYFTKDSIFEISLDY